MSRIWSQLHSSCHTGLSIFLVIENVPLVILRWSNWCLWSVTNSAYQIQKTFLNPLYESATFPSNLFDQRRFVRVFGVNIIGKKPSIHVFRWVDVMRRGSKRGSIAFSWKARKYIELFFISVRWCLVPTPLVKILFRIHFWTYASVLFANFFWFQSLLKLKAHLTAISTLI